MGGNSWPQYDLAKFVQLSIDLGQPIIGTNIKLRCICQAIVWKLMRLAVIDWGFWQSHFGGVEGSAVIAIVFLYIEIRTHK
jgi:hypothetical protein